MSNMSYCRFRNTLADLRDCEDSIYEPADNRDEERARLQMLIFMNRVVENYMNDPAAELKFLTATEIAAVTGASEEG